MRGLWLQTVKKLREWCASNERYDAAFSRYKYILEEYVPEQRDRILIELLDAHVSDLKDEIAKIREENSVIKLKGISTGDVKDFIMILLNNGYCVKSRINKSSGTLEISIEE